MKRGVTLRRDRHGRRFVLNLQIGYEGQQRDDGDNLPEPAEPTSPEIPPKADGYAKSYGNITSYEQWLERERKEQKRVTDSRLKRENNNSVMKKSIVVAAVGVVALAALAVSTAFAATGFGPDVVKIKSDPPQRVDAAFRLFETQNMWNFLLLDTRYGHVWQVQFSVQEDTESFMIELPLTQARTGRRKSTAIAPPAFPSPKRSTIVPSPGTFTLYPTQNMWNFLLLNQETGEMWQCQFGARSRFKMPIPVSR